MTSVCSLWSQREEGWSECFCYYFCDLCFLLPSTKPNQTHSAHSTSPPSNYCRALVAIYLCTTTIISQLYGTQGRRFHIEEAEKIGISCVLCVTSFRLLSPTDERHTMKIFANPWNDYLFAAGCMDLMVFSCLLKNILLFSCLGVPPRSLFHRPPNTPHETFLISCCKLARANTLQVNAGQIFRSTSSIQQCPSVHNLQRIIITALSMKHNSKAPLMNTKRKSREWFTLNTNTDRVGVGVRELISRGCLMCFLFLRRNQLQNDEQVVNFHDFSAP